MPSVSTVIFDNSLNSQNQDYLPNRYILQKEVIDKLITRILESDPESLIGLIPLAQKDDNDMLTPTSVKPHLSTFLYKRDLYYNTNYQLSFFQAEKSLQISEYSEKTIYMFLGTPIYDFDELLATICNLASKGIKIHIVCFADALEFGQYLGNTINLAEIDVILIYSDEDFNTKAENFFLRSGRNDYMDFDLEMALKRSMYEK